MKTLWQSSNELEKLIHTLVQWDSRTGTQGEVDFPYHLKEELLQLDYFDNHPEHIKLVSVGNKLNTLFAQRFVDNTKDTIVLISHFDTVHTEDFGELEPYAFNTNILTEKIEEMSERFSENVQRDIQTKEYIFGRGSMDMKMGLALHMHLIERAEIEEWPINLILMTVPDEEVGSNGMRAGVEYLKEIKERLRLEYKLFLNSEPSFSQELDDNNYYIYSGSIGKIMPAAVFYGKGTHAGEPTHGITSHYISSFMTKQMEFNDTFTDKAFDEKTPLPITLVQNDLKTDYSTQTSHHSYAFYNVFTFKKNVLEMMRIYKGITKVAMKACLYDYKEKSLTGAFKPFDHIKVLEYKELREYVTNKIGQDAVNNIIKDITQHHDYDERMQCVHIIDALMNYAQELAPATILFFAPPYYPAVNSSRDAVIKQSIQLVADTLRKKFDVESKQIHYFNGISDLSYLNYTGSERSSNAYKENTPNFGHTYYVPFDIMSSLKAPVLNVGPHGKDAHKLTERLNKNSAFIYTPYVLGELIQSFFE